MTLYFEKLRIEPKNPKDPDRDRFILGKALDIWAKEGSPKILTEVKDLDGGYKLVIASEAPLL